MYISGVRNKKVELRVTVFGHRVYTAEIDSQSQEFSKIDWRRTPQEGRNCYAVPQRPYSLPDQIEKKILLLLQRLGLAFGRLDFIVTPQNELVFLEINPNGQWFWIEEATGMPLLNTFTEMLIQGRSDFVEDKSASSAARATSVSF